MDDQTAERIHLRIDETHKLINEVKLAYTAQCQDMKSLDETVKNFVKKVDKSIFDTEEGFIIKTKTKLSNLCTQVKNQWYLITLLLVGVLGIAWGVISRK
jgi:CRISPR/Cas system-associated protein Csm6